MLSSLTIHNKKSQGTWYQRVIAMTKSDHVALKSLELVYVRNLEKFGDTDYRRPKML